MRKALIRPCFARPPSPAGGRKDSPPLPLAEEGQGEGWGERYLPALTEAIASTIASAIFLRRR